MLTAFSLRAHRLYCWHLSPPCLGTLWLMYIAGRFYSMPISTTSLFCLPLHPTFLLHPHSSSTTNLSSAVSNPHHLLAHISTGQGGSSDTDSFNCFHRLLQFFFFFFFLHLCTSLLLIINCAPFCRAQLLHTKHHLSTYSSQIHFFSFCFIFALILRL